METHTALFDLLTWQIEKTLKGHCDNQRWYNCLDIPVAEIAVTRGNHENMVHFKDKGRPRYQIGVQLTSPLLYDYRPSIEWINFQAVEELRIQTIRCHYDKAGIDCIQATPSLLDTNLILLWKHLRSK